jgi:hypothetical protein
MKATTPTQKPIPIFCSRVIPFKVGEIYRERETKSVGGAQTLGEAVQTTFSLPTTVQKGPLMQKGVVRGLICT